MRSPKSPARKALPPKGPAVVYVALHSGGYTSFFHNIEDARACVRRHGDGEDRIVRYLPAPVPPRSRKSKGGGRG